MDSVYDIQVLEELIRDPYQRKKFCNAFFKKALPLDVCLAKLPDTVWTLSFQSLELVERLDSTVDGATKLVFQTSDEHRIEAVILRIATGRTTLCISSQIGCSVGCKFCATAKLGFVRNLTYAEMLDQVLLAKRLLRDERRTLRNVVVMGMGEPLRNEENLFKCLEILRDPQFFNLSENHLLVSTVGISEAMVHFAHRFPKISLALSLHSARQEVRESLIPFAKFQTLEKLQAVFPKLGVPPIGLARAGAFMVEYLMLKGINDGLEDLAALIGLLRKTNAHINLIQFNTYPGASFEPVSKEAREAFGKELRKAGFKTTLRYSLGEDIAAACGQLAGTQGQPE